MDWIAPILIDIELLARPALFNVYFALASLPVGFVLAIGLAFGKDSGNGIVRALSRGYVYAFRGSPLFIQFFMFYSVMLALNQPLWRPMGINWLMMHPLFIGPLVLILNTTAYTAEIFSGALRAVPRGEIEAARAYGMSRFAQFRSVIWPNVIRLAWPAYTNEMVFLFHATALVYLALPVIDDQQDLMSAARRLFERDFNVFLHFSVAAGYFLVISLVIFALAGLVYRRLTRHMGEAAPSRLRFRPRYIR